MSEYEREAPRNVTTAKGSNGEWAALFPDQDRAMLRERWDAIQAGFVDEPRQAVQQADNLVDDTLKRLDSVFSDARAQLESVWSSNGDASTEDLRLALRRYRSFFDRLLSV